ncbi:major facilitator superfamily protein [Stylonychia lemnae]|uniref:Major facilitator superfamily protein n=1 Tax=Stylonychia lemnae TaxID=5949 RepID=A0A078AH21_STYLE|nr:major facilitator superfamily protein [Stylonychia lemnae]|eukprot:CDW81126.1 major facilitator superfamily protein [Stylonychia lemnae]
MRLKDYPNIKNVLYLSVCFFVLFFTYAASANVASKALKECGFNNLGYYSLSTVFMVFGLGSFFSSNIYLSYNLVVGFVIFCSILIGFAASILWVAQGKYLSDCSLVCQDKKGRYQGLFWTFMFISFFLSSIVSAFILGYFPQQYLFFLCTVIAMISTVMLHSLPDIEQLPQDHQTQINQQRDGSKLIKLMFDRRMIKTYGISLSTALSLSIRQTGLYPLISSSLQDYSVYDQFKYASFAQAMCGIGQLLGSTGFAFINDKFEGGKSVSQFSIHWYSNNIYAGNNR